MKPILIDTNALVVLIIGLMNPHILKTHKRTSIYEEQDLRNLLYIIQDISNLVVLPNVWTEVDNLLNSFDKQRKYTYLKTLRSAIEQTTEKYIPSVSATHNTAFIDLGITDSLLLEHAKECRLLITGDSALSDYASAYGIAVYDMVRARNERL
ncbi:hypothetical protein EJV47_21245 [Hymenobacter gummosus]|uniref:PIN domain-containing protein n=1 Tax=Hymenobacter gummosus TaxID=1776032 RepID=A0A431TXV6_9BACT|nr:hypothetical protein [Hymenobacter gummosus]RTQ46482.1 hypothetical protein EJV47_21245 [Hymenobacter gummosus]